MAEDPRLEKIQRLLEMEIDPWGQRLDDRTLIGDIRARADEVRFRNEAGQLMELPAIDDDNRDAFRSWVGEQGPGEFVGPAVRAAGRIVLQRKKGKLRFVDIRDHTGQIQLFIGRGQVGEDQWAISDQFDLGDIVAVDGQLRRTKMGELTIFAERLHFMTKALEPPPEKYHGLKDLELRQRMRYLDLTYGDGVMERFIARTKIVDSIRATLKNRQYFEVEGPTLHAIAGGAAARPFTTHHNTLDMDLFLRIALELHLKRLLVGGMDRVFELGRVYRNEGISPKHNPEFTMLEAYEAFGNYETMMDLTEQLIVDAIRTLEQGFQLPWGDQHIDYTPPFERATYDELFQRHAGIEATDEQAIRDLAKSIGIDVDQRHIDVIKNDVFEAKVEDELTGPVFVIDYPASICPLTKRKRDNLAVAERFELFVCGMEIANAYTELNDPILQEELFKTQLEGLPEDDSMAKMDHDFIRALRHGMPPAGGLGVGIDRLVMLLTNSQSIRDIVLFPLLRPES